MKTLQALMWVSASVVALGLLGCYGLVERSPRGTVYVAQPQPEYIIVPEAPPPIIMERRPPLPSRGHIWIDGNWHWSGQRYVWQPGRWAVPPHGRAVWVPPRYERDEHGYRYMPGRWGEKQRERQRGDQQRRDRG
jgi:hypothetical protein